MDWDAPAIVLDARPFGEGDAIATVMTEEHGLHRGLARGGGSRAQAGLWQPGNLAQVRWVARLSDQLGSFSAEMIHPGAAFVIDDPLALAMLSAVCAVAEGALPEREPHPRVFHGLVHLVARLPHGAAMLDDLVRWETTLLADLGYGLDLASCALTGATDGLAYVSPRTGRAVTEAAAGIWKSRLLRLPSFLAGRDAATLPNIGMAESGAAETGMAESGMVETGTAESGAAETGTTDVGMAETGAPGTSDAIGWRDGLALTGHFLARDAFGAQHRPLPRARQMLYDRVAAMAADSDKTISEGSDAG